MHQAEKKIGNNGVTKMKIKSKPYIEKFRNAYIEMSRNSYGEKSRSIY